MRLKGISWIEQHFEKVFAGVFGVAAVGVLIWQFAGPANTVTVGPKKDVPLDQAYDDVIAAAQRTRGEIEQVTIEPPVLPESANPIAAFEKNYRGPVAPALELAIALGRGANIGEVGPLRTALNAPLPKLAIPAPTNLVAYSYMSTVHPAEAATPEVAAVLPAKAPFDKASVTVEGRFNGEGLRTLLETDPDGAGPIAPMQRGWWESMQLLGVEMERQELQADGTWGKAAKVAVMPGRFSLLPEIEKGVPDAETLGYLKADAADRAEEVRRPEFYDLWMGEDWLPPTDQLAVDEAARAGGNDANARLMSDKRSLERRLETNRNRRAAMGPMTGGGPGGRDRPDAGRDDPGRRGGGGGGGGGKGAGRGGGGRQGPTDTGRTYTDAQREAMDRSIASDEKRLADINRELGIAPPSEAEAQVAGRRAAEAGVFDSEDLRLWAHDVMVERGRTYRYRMVLVFNNPLFGRGSVMAPDQAEWARTTLVRSEPSAWSEPIEVARDYYWFITAANPPSAAQLNRSPDARAELFVFTMGYWRRGGTNVEPGDPIVAEVSVPDVTKLEAMLPADEPGQPIPGVPGVPGGPPPRDGPGGGGGKRAPTGGGGRQNAHQPELPPQAPDAGAEVAKLAMVNQKVPTDAILLGVGTSPLATTAGGRQATQAFVRIGNGEVRTVVPEAEKASAEYARMNRSAEAARQAAQLREAERRDQEPAPGRRQDRDPPPPGGGAPPPGGSGGG